MRKGAPRRRKSCGTVEKLKILPSCPTPRFQEDGLLFGFSIVQHFFGTSAQPPIHFTNHVYDDQGTHYSPVKSVSRQFDSRSIDRGIEMKKIAYRVRSFVQWMQSCKNFYINIIIMWKFLSNVIISTATFTEEQHEGGTHEEDDLQTCQAFPPGM